MELLKYRAREEVKQSIFYIETLSTCALLVADLMQTFLSTNITC
jgi:hypothetical protein